AVARLEDLEGAPLRAGDELIDGALAPFLAIHQPRRARMGGHTVRVAVDGEDVAHARREWHKLIPRSQRPVRTARRAEYASRKPGRQVPRSDQSRTVPAAGPRRGRQIPSELLVPLPMPDAYRRSWRGQRLRGFRRSICPS